MQRSQTREMEVRLPLADERGVSVGSNECELPGLTQSIESDSRLRSGDSIMHPKSQIVRFVEPLYCRDYHGHPVLGMHK